MTFEERVERLFPGSRVVSKWPLRGGISATMTAFDLTHPDGDVERMIARQPGNWAYASRCEHPAFKEFEILLALRRAGLPSPNPRACEEKSDDVPSPFFVVDYIEGRPEVAPHDPQAFLDRYVQQLIEIHQIGVEDFKELLPQQNYDLSRPAGDMNAAMRESEIREKLLLKPVNKPVLRHGDFWPGNILWHDEKIAAVIDWEEALIGEPLADLAICRLDILWILGWEAAKQVTERYLGKTQLDATHLPHWDLWASLRPIRNIDQWSPAYSQLGRPDITTDTMIRDHQFFVDQAFSALQ